MECMWVKCVIFACMWMKHSSKCCICSLSAVITHCLWDRIWTWRSRIFKMCLCRFFIEFSAMAPYAVVSAVHHPELWWPEIIRAFPDSAAAGNNGLCLCQQCTGGGQKTWWRLIATKPGKRHIAVNLLLNTLPQLEHLSRRSWYCAFTVITF